MLGGVALRSAEALQGHQWGKHAMHAAQQCTGAGRDTHSTRHSLKKAASASLGWSTSQHSHSFSS